MIRKILKDPLAKAFIAFAGLTALQAILSTDLAEETRTKITEAKQEICLRSAWSRGEAPEKCFHQTVSSHTALQEPKKYEL